MSLGFFRAQNGIQFIPYTEPPKSQSRCKPLLKGLRHEDVCPNPDRKSSTRPAIISHQAGDIGLASTGKNICKLIEFGSGCDEIGCPDDLPPLDGKSMEDDHFSSKWFSGEVLRKDSSDPPHFEGSRHYDLPQIEHRVEYDVPGRSSRGSEESPGQSAPMEGSSQECAVVIEDSPSKPDTNTKADHYPREDDLGTPKHDVFDNAGLLASDHDSTDSMEDALSLKFVKGSESRDGGSRCGEFSRTPSTPPTELSFMGVGQPVQEASSDTLSDHVTMNQLLGSMNREVEKQGELAHLENMSSSSSDESDNGNENDASNHGKRVTHKRRRYLPDKQHGRMSGTTSKRRALGMRNCGHDSTICYSVDDSDSHSDSSRGSDRDCHLRSPKRRKPASRPRRLRSRSFAGKEPEFEVDQILKARVHYRKLQYLVKWVEHDDDGKWYNACNFKNSPHKLREFHDANRDPRPPERLEVWTRCWEEERDADDHPDDNKPQRPHTGRSTPAISRYWLRSSPKSPSRC